MHFNEYDELFQKKNSTLYLWKGLLPDSSTLGVGYRNHTKLYFVICLLFRFLMSMSVCVSVCLSVRNHKRDLYQFVYVLPMAVARSFSGVVAIHNVLPV